MAMPSSPCIKLCTIDPRSGLCIGCGRTLAEIAAWSTMDETARQAIMHDLTTRLRMVTPPPSRCGLKR
jgi:predicted Fe-S protein YdhL (DUF1289 family)